MYGELEQCYMRKVATSASGSAVTGENEVNVKSEAGVSVVDVNKAELMGPREVQLTNYRLIFLHGDASAAIELQDVHAVQDCAAGAWFGTSTRVQVTFTGSRGEIYLKFKEDKGAFLANMERVLTKRAWAQQTLNFKQAHSAPAMQGFDTRKAGVAGLQRRREKEREEVDSVVGTATGDLDALMGRARDVVVIVQRYAAYTDPSTASASACAGAGTGAGDCAGAGIDEEKERDAMETILANIGIVSPVTRLTAGGLYHKALARQMADVLSAQSRLDRMGGLITLTDLYCLLNRARGSELVSPDDLLQSAHLLVRLDVGMYLRRFPSGALCVQSQGFDEDGMCAKILAMASAAAGTRIHAAQVASAFRTSLVVATNHLLVATARGHMCVDESRSGTFYYANTFTAFAYALEADA